MSTSTYKHVCIEPYVSMYSCGNETAFATATMNNTLFKKPLVERFANREVRHTMNKRPPSFAITLRTFSRRKSRRPSSRSFLLRTPRKRRPRSKNTETSWKGRKTKSRAFAMISSTTRIVARSRRPRLMRWNVKSTLCKTRSTPKSASS